MVHAQLSEKERAEKAAQLQHLRERISKLRTDIDSKKGLYNSVSKELQKTEKAIAGKVAQLKKTNRKLKQQQRRLQKLYRDKQKKEEHINKQQALLGQQLRTAYMIGRQEYLKLLLNQQDPAALSRVMVYYDYFNKARTARIEQTLEAIAKLEDIKQQIEKQNQVLTQIKQQQLTEKQQLEASYQQRAAVVARLKKELSGKDKQLSQLLENEQQLQALLAVIREVMPEMLNIPDKSLPFARLKGHLTWPAAGNIKSLFGRKRGGGRLTWNGILIKAKTGREVHAISRGRVAYADWLRGYGMLLILDHGDGYMSLYGHNQSLFKETGDWVEAGEVIATMGNSGGQEQSGLYFEIRHNGRPTNPAKWCRKKRRS